MKDIKHLPLYQVEALDNKDLNLFELDEKRTRLTKAQQNEYTTRGNTHRCQDLWKQIEAVKEEMDRR